MFDDENRDDFLGDLENGVEDAVDTEYVPTPADFSEDGMGDETEEKPTDKEDSKKSEQSAIGSDIIRGHINTIILRALYERDKYGYEIMTDIEQKSHGQYTLKQPTLYSALKRLETQGYIKAYWKTDEVTSGGRRKYFKLTDSGKEITERNLAEWEYSRTIIDNLISDRSFDFSNPAPTPVDFTILRNSVSRVPIVKTDDDEIAEEKKSDAVEASALEFENKVSETFVGESNVQSSETKIEIVEQPKEAEQAYTSQQEYYSRQQQLFAEQQPPTEACREEQPAKPSSEEQTETAQISEQTKIRQRQIVHENYLRLVAEPVREQPKEDIVEASRNVNAENLIYNNKPETERDYKNLIDGIYNRTLVNGSVQTNYNARISTQHREFRQGNVKLIDRGRADGVSVAPSVEYNSNVNYATKTTYNKGLTLLKCSAIVLAVLVIEAVLCFLFMGQLQVSWVYPFVILMLGLIQFSVFGVLFLRGYGKNCVRPTTNSYISTCVILTVIAILIICAASFLLNMNPTLASDVLKMIVIPSISALNITVFALLFKKFVK